METGWPVAGPTARLMERNDRRRRKARRCGPTGGCRRQMLVTIGCTRGGHRVRCDGEHVGRPRDPGRYPDTEHRTRTEQPRLPVVQSNTEIIWTRPKYVLGIHAYNPLRPSRLQPCGIAPRNPRAQTNVETQSAVWPPVAIRTEGHGSTACPRCTADRKGPCRPLDSTTPHMLAASHTMSGSLEGSLSNRTSPSRLFPQHTCNVRPTSSVPMNCSTSSGQRTRKTVYGCRVPRMGTFPFVASMAGWFL